MFNIIVSNVQAWIGIMFATFAVLLSLHVFALIVTRASRNDANISIAEKRGNKAIFFAIVILLRQGTVPTYALVLEHKLCFYDM